MWHLFLQYLDKVLSPVHQNGPSRKRGNFPCLHLTSPELFQICLHYVCNLYCVHYVHNIKILSILSSWLWRNKTHVCNSITRLQQCFSIPNARPCSWMSHNFTIWMSWAETQVQFTLLCTWFLLKDNHSTQQYLPRLNTHGVKTHSIRSIPPHCQIHTSTKSV